MSNSRELPTKLLSHEIDTEGRHLSDRPPRCLSCPSGDFMSRHQQFVLGRWSRNSIGCTRLWTVPKTCLHSFLFVNRIQSSGMCARAARAMRALTWVRISSISLTRFCGPPNKTGQFFIRFPCRPASLTIHFHTFCARNAAFGGGIRM